MPGKYAGKTTVSVQKSRNEIENILQRFGADKFGYMTERDGDHEVAIIAFRIERRNVRLDLFLPGRDEERFTTTPGRGLGRTEQQAHAAWEQECRRMWRSLAEVIKAKLIAVEDGIGTIEDEFLAHIVMPDGRTVSEHVTPTIEKSYVGGKMMPLFPLPKE